MSTHPIYTDLRAADRRRAAKVVRKQLSDGAELITLIRAYSQLYTNTTLDRGAPNPYWLYCYELLSRLARLRGAVALRELRRY